MYIVKTFNHSAVSALKSCISFSVQNQHISALWNTDESYYIWNMLRFNIKATAVRYTKLND